MSEVIVKDQETSQSKWIQNVQIQGKKIIVPGNLQRQRKSKRMKTVHKNNMIVKIFYNNDTK